MTLRWFGGLHPGGWVYVLFVLHRKHDLMLGPIPGICQETVEAARIERRSDHISPPAGRRPRLCSSAYRRGPDRHCATAFASGSEGAVAQADQAVYDGQELARTVHVCIALQRGKHGL